jgi:hypothetical protein
MWSRYLARVSVAVHRMWIVFPMDSMNAILASCMSVVLSSNPKQLQDRGYRIAFDI